MKAPVNISIDDYNYTLPEDRIAKFPLTERDQSKLLFLKGNSPAETSFSYLPDLLPEKCLLVFNETKVIRARLLFTKKTGASVEIFCLEPKEPVQDFQLAFQQTSPVVWKCLVGNSARWKTGKLELKIACGGKVVELTAEKIEILPDSFMVMFSWNDDTLRFGEIIETGGVVPLPPYLQREAVKEDSVRYQTVYARYDGSVAAPTAGLHFTDLLMDRLKKSGSEFSWLTLHVGAGTFRPVLHRTIGEHIMHHENIVVSRETIVLLSKKIGKPIIPVGTTSMRTIESLYWLGANINSGNHSLSVGQWDAYEERIPVSPQKAIQNLIDFMDAAHLKELKATTQLIIAPGYSFKIATGLITNFHQPKSTLLLLVAALVGDNWKELYNYALENQFRFLSYGDSCLFLKGN